MNSKTNTEEKEVQKKSKKKEKNIISSWSKHCVDTSNETRKKDNSHQKSEWMREEKKNEPKVVWFFCFGYRRTEANIYLEIKLLRQSEKHNNSLKPNTDWNSVSQSQEIGKDRPRHQSVNWKNWSSKIHQQIYNELQSPSNEFVFLCVRIN